MAAFDEKEKKSIPRIFVFCFCGWGVSGHFTQFILAFIRRRKKKKIISQMTWSSFFFFFFVWRPVASAKSGNNAAPAR